MFQIKNQSYQSNAYFYVELPFLSILEQARKKIGLPKKSLPKSETQPAPKPKTPRVQQHDKKPDQTEQEFWQSVMS